MQVGPLGVELTRDVQDRTHRVILMNPVSAPAVLANELPCVVAVRFDRPWTSRVRAPNVVARRRLASRWTLPRRAHGAITPVHGTAFVFPAVDGFDHAHHSAHAQAPMRGARSREGAAGTPDMRTGCDGLGRRTMGVTVYPCHRITAEAREFARRVRLWPGSAPALRRVRSHVPRTRPRAGRSGSGSATIR
jgi:hypothetical protein